MVKVLSMENVTAGWPMAGLWGAAQWEFEILEGLQRFRSPWTDRAMMFFTSLADHGRLWILLGLLLLCFSKTRCVGASLLCSVGLGYVTGNLILKNLFARSRPCWIRREAALLAAVPMDYSFPSGHTLVSFEGAWVLWRHDRKWGAAALVVAAAIAFSRMYLFVHFPTDILGGVILGAANGRGGEWMAKRMGLYDSAKGEMKDAESGR